MNRRKRERKGETLKPTDKGVVFIVKQNHEFTVNHCASSRDITDNTLFARETKRQKHK